MKLIKLPKLLLLLAVFLSATHVRAGDVTLFVTLTVKIVVQNTNFDNGTTTITAAPIVKTRTTKDILTKLARDKFAAGIWSSNSFPRTARLAVIPTSGPGDFVVMNGTNILVDVSDIISFDSGDNEIISGRENDNTGLASPTKTKRHVGRITFDDTAFNDSEGGLQFYLQGLVTQTTTDTTPTAGGTYTERRTSTIPSVAGEGTSNIGTGDEHPFVISGSVVATGSAILSL